MSKTYPGTYRHPYKGGADVDWLHWGPNEDADDDSYLERDRKALVYLEKVTSQPDLEQKLHLEYILKRNAKTEYLQKHGMNGATDANTFRRCIPVVDYEAFRESIDRIATGDTSPILSGDPPLEALISSGTSSGDPQIFPVCGEDLAFRGLLWNCVAPTLRRAMPSLEGKYLNFIFRRPGTQIPSGLPARTAVTSYLHSDQYKQRLFHPIYDLSSPDEVLEMHDTNSAMYCHLLCALVQRHEIRRVGAIYATVVIKALRVLEKWWAELCDDIASGTLNETLVQDEIVRAAVLPVLLEKGPEVRAELARSLREECLSKDGVFRQEGIIPRLWPNCEVIDTGGTGMMKAYLPSLAHYSNNMRVICTPLYAATEGFFGVCMDPSVPPEETYYVLMPSVAYYEFIPIGEPKGSSESKLGSPKVHPAERKDEIILDLVSLKVGQQYELIVTTISGFCRLSMGDILEVVGSYNNSPLFKFVRRKNKFLSVDEDKTYEEDLHEVVREAATILETELSGVRLLEYTSYTLFGHGGQPGHYVIIWELRFATASSAPTMIPSLLLDRCCNALEASLNIFYRGGRCDGRVGPLEINIVLPGTFDLLCEYAVSRGATINQYKVPRILGPKQPALREIVASRVIFYFLFFL